MKIQKFNEAFNKKETKEYLDNKFNIHTHEYVVYNYPSNELFHGTLDECLAKLENLRKSFIYRFNHIFIIEREIKSRHIDEDELRQLLDAKKYNL